MRRPDTQDSGSILRDAAVLAMARLQSGPDLLGSWSDGGPEALRRAAAQILHQRVDAMRVISADAERLNAGIDLVPFLEEGGPFGPAWSAHPLASSAFGVGYRLREPDITRELASLMGPHRSRRGAERALSFLRVLTEIAGAHEVAVTLTAGTRPSVMAEHPVRRTSRRNVAAPAPLGRASVPRIDLLFDWPVNDQGRRAVVVIEAKLGALVSDGQLRPYREEARRRAKGGPIALILLTAWSDKAEKRHRAWRPVRWFSLLRRWEAVLAEAGDADPEFSRVRADLWRFVFSVRKARS